MNKEHKKLLKKNFESAVNAYVDAFLDLFKIGKSYTWWIRDRIGRDLFCFAEHVISLDEMIYCVENDVGYCEFLEYEEYNVKCCDYNLPTLNLESFHKGAPRHDFSKLDALREELNNEVDKLNKCKGGF